MGDSTDELPHRFQLKHGISEYLRYLRTGKLSFLQSSRINHSSSFGVSAIIRFRQVVHKESLNSHPEKSILCLAIIHDLNGFFPDPAGSKSANCLWSNYWSHYLDLIHRGVSWFDLIAVYTCEINTKGRFFWLSKNSAHHKDRHSSFGLEIEYKRAVSWRNWVTFMSPEDGKESNPVQWGGKEF